MTDRIAAPISPVAASAWGIDVGRNALRALRLGYDAATHRAVALSFDVVEYPEALRLESSHALPILTAAVESFRERNDLDDCRIAVSTTGLIRSSRLPRTSSRRLRDLITYEAARQIPLALSDVVWDYHAHSDERDFFTADHHPMTEVTLCALTREGLERMLIPFGNCGVDLDLVQLTAVAVANFVNFDQADGDREDVLALLDVGTWRTDLIIQLGERFWHRVIPIGGNHFTEALAAALGLSFESAEHVKCNIGKGVDPHAKLRAMAGAYDDLINQAERCLGYFLALHPEIEIGRTILLGNGSKLPGLTKLLPARFSTQVDRLDRFARLVGDEVLTAPMFRAHLASFGTAYGLGLQAIGLGAWRTNLLPPELRAKRGWSLGGLLERLRPYRIGR